MSAKLKHGHSTRSKTSRTYHSWDSMTQRCKQLHRPEAKNYVVRGIKVCTALQTFTGFLLVLGECPPALELDRWPNNDGHYSCGSCLECVREGWPLNVRWTTHKENNRNKRNNRVFTVRGITGCLTELAEHFGIRKRRVYHRLEHGWTVEKAFTQPVRKFSSSPPPLPPAP